MQDELAVAITRIGGCARARFRIINREDEGGSTRRDNPLTMKNMKGSRVHPHRIASDTGVGSPPVKSARYRSSTHGGSTERERGAVIVEFALILPLLVILTFGLIEFSSAYHVRSATADAARAGARVGSAQATNPAFETSVVQAVNAALSSTPADEPQELWIYKANNAGYPGSGTGFSSCSGNCIKYSWSKGARAFTGSSGSWAATSHQVCKQPYDEIGVYIKVDHPFITKLFGSSVTLTDHAVFRFEPVASSACSS